MPIKIPIRIGGNFYWNEFSEYKDAEKVHPVIFTRLIDNLQYVRDYLNRDLNSYHWLVTAGLDPVDYVGSEISVTITGFTRPESWSIAEYARQKKLKEEGKIKKISVSLTSTHHPEHGACAVDFKAVNKRTRTTVPSRIVAKIISSHNELYDYLMPHYNKAGKYFNLYTDSHVHMDLRKLAVALGVRKV